MVQLAGRLRSEIGRLAKVLPAALVAAAMRPALGRSELEERVDHLLEILRLAGANLDVGSGREALDAAAEPLATRGIIVIQGHRYRIRQRGVLRYYSRSIRHLLHDRGRSALTH